jgi:ubiquinone/menaquinone biosynthesis C-methylase UbiE
VGCGPGALTVAVAEIVGEQSTAGIDPEEQLLATCRARVPAADVRQGFAEQLPWADGEFDAAVSQLVVAFMDDAQAGVREMRRVVKPGGTVAIAMWDATLLEVSATFRKAAMANGVDFPPGVRLATTSEPELRGLAEGAGLSGITAEQLRVESTYTGFDDLWEPYTFGIGPIGSLLKNLDEERTAGIRDTLRAAYPDPNEPITLSAVAWAVRGTV